MKIFGTCSIPLNKKIWYKSLLSGHQANKIQYVEWKETLKQCSLMPKNIPSGNIIKINNKMKTLVNVTGKDFYWHLLNTEILTLQQPYKNGIFIILFLKKPAQMFGPEF